jgi:hypothetical protein
MMGITIMLLSHPYKIQDYFSCALTESLNTHKGKEEKLKIWDGMNRFHCYTAVLFHKKYIYGTVQ